MSTVILIVGLQLFCRM